MPAMVLRVALCLLSLCVAAALAVQLYAHNRLQEARLPTFLAGQKGLSPDVRAQVLEDLEAAEPLRPGTDVLVTEALVRVRAGDSAGAERAARRAVEREPENFAAHDALAAALRERDPAAAAREARRSRELNPLTP